jgi:hypothetical protein
MGYSTIAKVQHALTLPAYLKKPIIDSIGAIIYPNDGFAKPQRDKYELVMPSNPEEPHYFLLFKGQGKKIGRNLQLQYSSLFRITDRPQGLMAVINNPNVDQVVESFREAYDKSNRSLKVRKIKIPIVHWIDDSFIEHNKEYEENSSIRIGLMRSRNGKDIASEFENTLNQYDLISILVEEGWEFIKRNVNSRAALFSQFDM